MIKVHTSCVFCSRPVAEQFVLMHPGEVIRLYQIAFQNFVSVWQQGMHFVAVRDTDIKYHVILIKVCWRLCKLPKRRGGSSVLYKKRIFLSQAQFYIEILKNGD